MNRRIIHVVSSLNVGGAEKFVCNLAIEQAAQGHDVAVMSYGKNTEPFQATLAIHDVPVINVRAGLVARRLQTLCLKQYSIIHIHSPAVIRALAPVILLLSKLNLVYTIHGEVDPPQALVRLAHRVARWTGLKVTAVSEAARESVTRRYGWSPEAVVVVPNGMSLPLAPANPPSPTRLRLGVVARLIPLKNIALLFSSLDQIPSLLQENLEVHIFGDGPERPFLEAAAQARADILCTFHGNVGDEAAIYNCFDLLVMCSDTEGLPMSIIEAMGYGKPVVATDVGAIGTVVIPGETGWLYSPRDASALAAILETLLQNPEIVPEFGANAREKVQASYSIAAIDQRFEEIYLQPAGRAR